MINIDMNRYTKHQIMYKTIGSVCKWLLVASTRTETIL